MGKYICIVLFLLIVVYISNVIGGESSRQKKEKSPVVEENSEIVLTDILKKDGKSRKRILYITDDYHYSHFVLNKTLANILSEIYDVEMLVYKCPNREYEESDKFRLIYVPIVDDFKCFETYRMSDEFEYIGIYDALISNTKVKVPIRKDFAEEIGIMEYLNMNRYDLGIGEYSEMASIVTIFAELQIETTINISPSIFLTHFLEFLEVDLSNICIPDVNNVHRHDGLPNSEICVKGKSNLAEQTLSKQKHYYKTYYEKCIKSDLKGKIKLQDIEEPQNIEIAKNLRQKFHPLKLIKNIKCCFINQHELGNSKNYSNCNKIDLKEKIKLQNIEEMEKLRQKFHPLELFKKIEYHFVNQHELGNFRNYPKHDKIVYIGGILIEERGILNKSKIPVNPQDHKCVVLFSTGTAVNFVKEDRKNIEDMFKIFSTFDDCKFIVRIKKSIIPEVYSKNIEIFDSKYEANEIKSDNHKKISKQELIDQQGILAKENTQLFISHCGQNSLIEAIYAGVPLICIPFNGDQPYNSAIVENLEIGMWVEREKIGEQIGEALIEILKKKKYTKAARELRNKILKLPPRKHIFLEKIAEAIKEN